MSRHRWCVCSKRSSFMAPDPTGTQSGDPRSEPTMRDTRRAYVQEDSRSAPGHDSRGSASATRANRSCERARSARSRRARGQRSCGARRRQRSKRSQRAWEGTRSTRDARCGQPRRYRSKLHCIQPHGVHECPSKRATASDAIEGESGPHFARCEETDQLASGTDGTLPAL